MAREAGLDVEHFRTQTGAWAAYDNGGDLDLYVGDEHFRSQLLRNDRGGTFTDVAREAGVTNDDSAKASALGDCDQNPDPDW